ncbi:MAG TPA: hypothetical protein VF637_14015 [Sphingomicrobium sp.]
MSDDATLTDADPSRGVKFSTRAAVMRAVADPGLMLERISTESAYEHLSHWQARAAIKTMWDEGWRPTPPKGDRADG